METPMAHGHCSSKDATVSEAEDDKQFCMCVCVCAGLLAVWRDTKLCTMGKSEGLACRQHTKPQPSSSPDQK
eukprot:3787603-Amphidinium_carterae.1